MCFPLRHPGTVWWGISLNKILLLSMLHTWSANWLTTVYKGVRGWTGTVTEDNGVTHTHIHTQR